ncbi:hypothetical protein OAT16_03085 [Prolixibacteraceae bacterium]|nr:hypothetical protein [Prolixibacteraceae bacterium]
MKWFKNGEKLHQAALRYIDRGKNKKALGYLYAASEKKYVEAKCVLAFHEIYDFNSSEWKEFEGKTLLNKILFVAYNFLNTDHIAKADRWFRFAIKKGAKNIWPILGDAHEARNNLEEAVSCYMKGVKDHDAYCAFKAAHIADIYPYSVHHITIEEKVDLYFYAAKEGIKEAYEPVASIFEDGVTVEVSKKLAIQWYEKAAENSESAQLKLGELLKYDQPKKSRYWFLRATKSGNVQAALVIAREHIDRGEIDVAMQILTPILDHATGEVFYLYATIQESEEREKYLYLSAEKNCTDAYFDLYLLYQQKGEIVRAYEYLDLAVESRHVKALFHQGVRYAKDKDWEQAYAFFSRAALHSNKEALKMMAKYHWIGRGTAADKNQALLYLRRAASEEHQLSRYVLALLYQKGKLVVQNMMQAKTMFSQVTGPMSKYALFHLGIINMEQNKEEAKRCFERSFSKGYFAAAWHLGYGHEMQQWRISRISEAIVYYNIAATNGYPESFNNIGVIFHYGKDGIIDLDRAESNYLKAIEHYVVHAYYNYAVLLIQLSVPEKDLKAIELLQYAVSKEFVPAMVLLGSLHLDKHMSGASEENGISLLRQASDLGDITAKDILLEKLG